MIQCDRPVPISSSPAETSFNPRAIGGTLLLPAFHLAAAPVTSPSRTVKADVCVYGATSGGVSLPLRWRSAGDRSSSSSRPIISAA